MNRTDLVTWVQWTGATRAHAGIQGVAPGDVRNGNFPLECGRWAPEAWDADLWQAPNGRKCRRCLAAALERYKRLRADTRCKHGFDPATCTWYSCKVARGELGENVTVF